MQVIFEILVVLYQCIEYNYLSKIIKIEETRRNLLRILIIIQH